MKLLYFEVVCFVFFYVCGTMVWRCIMFTLYDYVDYYKNSDFSDVPFNVMDALLFSCLVYLPIKSFDGDKSFKDFYEYASSFYRDDFSGVMKPCSFTLLNKIKSSKRYSKIVISDFENVRNSKTQFGAMCVSFNNCVLIVFKGSDSSLISWAENIRLNYQYPTYTQAKAIDYASRHVSSGKDVYLLGHSKGGNLAMCSAMEMSNDKFSFVKKIYNFDGPGFLKSEYDNKFDRIKGRLVNIVPTGSVVGMCLYNDNYKVVKSKDLAFSEHYPIGWNVFGEFFVSGKLSKVSKQIHEMTTKNLDGIDRKELSDALEMLCTGVGKDFNSDFSFNVSEILNILKNMKGIDPKVYRYLSSVLQALMKI